MKTIRLLTASLFASTAFISFADAASKGQSIFVPIVTAVGKETVTVRSGRNAGLKVTSAAGTREPASNIETYKVTPSTTITVNGLKASLAEIKPGMRADVTAGMDRASAHRIVAVILPPPQPKPAPRAGLTDKNAKGPRTLFSRIDAYEVIQISADKITVSQAGGSRSMSYQIGSFTAVEVNGKPGELNDVRVGMKVIVNASLELTKAARIVASDHD